MFIFPAMSVADVVVCLKDSPGARFDCPRNRLLRKALFCQVWRRS